jgi:hypothetical protein
MKLFKFYKIPSEDVDTNGMHITDKYPLYAFTNDKNLAKKFEKERRKDLFIKIVDKGLSREEYAQFAINNRGSDLKIQKLVTSSNKNTNKQVIKKIPILLTQNEYVSCNEPMLLIMDESWWIDVTECVLANPYVFNNEIREALRILQYNVSFKVNNQDIRLMDIIDEEDDDYSAPEIEIDEVEIFIKLYGDTFK